MKKRLIARIDVKNEFAIKGIQLEGLRKVGDPNDLARRYYGDGIDEILFIDAVASYYDRNSLTSVIERASDDIFVPITVGGGIRRLEDIREVLRAGADKVAINTQAIREHYFIADAAAAYGSQCIVASIQAKRVGDGRWLAYYDNGRESSAMDVLQWACELEAMGAGELLVTSIDCDGTRKGYDLELALALMPEVHVPVIFCGGAGCINDIARLFASAAPDAAAMGSILHYGLAGVSEIKRTLNGQGVEVRR